MSRTALGKIKAADPVDLPPESRRITQEVDMSEIRKRMMDTVPPPPPEKSGG